MTAATQAQPHNGGVTLANVEVVNHLLFHKALIDDNQGNDRINQYLSLVKEGEHVSLKDQFDRSIALVFDLVIQEQLNVWDVDLVRFSELYLKRAKQEQIDLVTAGRIILMAWTVLKMQSEDLVRKFEQRQLETEHIEWEQIDTPVFGDEALDFTHRVLGIKAPIDEKIWHEGDRPVTLMELVNAFEEARREAETRVLSERQRDKLRQMLKAEGIARFKGRVHREDLEEDIRNTWSRICGLNGGSIFLNQIYDRADVWDFVTTFNSVLFLHRDQRIRLWQDNFPFGPVQLQNLEKPGTPPSGSETPDDDEADEDDEEEVHLIEPTRPEAPPE